jgi:hypothetical protein
MKRMEKNHEWYSLNDNEKNSKLKL